MKTIKFLSLTLVTLFFVNLSSCKYEDGPGLSLRTKKSRLTGTWDVERITESDGDVFTPNSNNHIVYYFDKDGTGDYALTVFGVTGRQTLKWEFVDSKKKLQITYENGDIIRPKIKRLTNDEFWALTADGDEWKLKKQ